MPSTIALLNRLLTIHYRSFPMYLAESGSWRTVDAADDEISQALQGIVFDQRQTSQRLAEAILDAGGTIGHSSFPMEYTDKNDLSLEYLVGEMIESLRRDTSAIERVVAAVRPSDATVRELAEEALGAAKAHLDTLERLAAKQPA